MHVLYGIGRPMHALYGIGPPMHVLYGIGPSMHVLCGIGLRTLWNGITTATSTDDMQFWKEVSVIFPPHLGSLKGL